MNKIKLNTKKLPKSIKNQKNPFSISRKPKKRAEKKE
jgi:hypothetical protein